MNPGLGFLGGTTQIKRLRKDFPFLFAFVVAILLHATLGFVLRFAPLHNAVAQAVTPKTPLTVRFVDVPSDSKTSGAIAGEVGRPAEAHKEVGRPSSSRKQSPREEKKLAAVIKPRSSSYSSNLPPIESPTLSPAAPDFEDYSVSEDQESKEKNTSPNLSKSLGDLDRYIGNNGSSAQEGGSGGTDTGSGVFFDTQGYDLGPWGNKVVAIVRSNWLIPVAAEMGSKGVVAISFQVDRMGNIINLNVTSPSNVPSFNQAALNALRSSNPFPPLPADFPRPVLPAVFRFFYNTPVEN